MRISDRSSDVCSSDLSLLDDIPHDLPVHSKIVVDQTVAHSGDLRPFDLWMVRAKLRRQPFCRLAENLEVPNHRVLRPDVAKEACIVQTVQIHADPRDRKSTRLNSSN